ncbi:MAG: glycoside hydrolase family 3 domain protein [Actinotalea sp.]|nr:glycoside hydrolase family 3 domain protein [Actinotalea sp.]
MRRRPSPGTAPALAALASCALLGGCTVVASASSTGPAAGVQAQAPPAHAAGGGLGLVPDVPPGRQPDATPACVPAPLEEQAAAVLVVGIPGATTSRDPLARSVVDLGVGGIFLSEPNVESADQVRALVADLRDRADRPLIVSTDEESGRVAVTREIVGSGPSPRRLAAQRTPAEVRKFATGLGKRLHDVGVDLDLAPLLDLDDGPYGGIIGDRSFSGDPERAAEYGLAFSAGLLDAGVQPTVKHFPGHGRSTTDTHAETDVVEATLEELRTTDLLPFQRAIDAGAPVVMLNHLQYAALDPELPASLSPRAYELLRDMGFDGVAMTDSVGMGAVNLRWDFPAAAVAAIGAGADAVLATDGGQAVRMRDALVEAVRTGALPEERLAEAAARVTALAGGDPMTMCVDVRVPTLTVPRGAPQG